MSEHLPLILHWRCAKCCVDADISIPPGTYAIDLAGIIERAHAMLVPACANEWGGAYVRVSQENYPD